MNEADPARSRSSARPPASWPPEQRYHRWRARVAQSLIAVAALAAAFGIGRLTRPGNGPTDPGGAGASTADAARTWTCSMHPQIKLPKFGPCPICFMDLIPVATGGDAADAPRLALSERARMLAQVETSVVEPRLLTHDVRMVGKVAVDETRLTYISSYLPGRLDRLFVDYTGMMVRQGDHLAEIYSPDLLVAQRGFLVALEADERARRQAAPDPFAAGSTRTVLDAARRKLELWGIPRDEIERLVRERQPSDHTRIDAPATGWVVERQGFQGMYTETGTRLFTLADLRRVWVLLEAYELDVPFIGLGQAVEFEVEAHPGRTFTGQVAFIDPLLRDESRTVRVRLSVANDDLALRPGMFVRARVRTQLGRTGQVLNDALRGRWICPMHPDVVKRTTASCDTCGMPLVRAESLGLAIASQPAGETLAVPASAVLLTGTRSVVYVEQRKSGEVSYEGRVVRLGPRAGDWYVVLSGLTSGERVATRGAVQIDSALQIQARPSMMQIQTSDDSDATALPEVVSRARPGAAYHAGARPMIRAYLELSAALAREDVVKSRAALAAVRKSADAARPDGLSEEDAREFAKLMRGVAGAAPDDPRIEIEAIRGRLPALTRALELYARTFGHDLASGLHRAYCPMAFNDRGAYWLQDAAEINNAYFASKMLRCGEIRGVIGVDGKERPAHD